MHLNYVKARLKAYKRREIIISRHALERCVERGITKEDIFDNILNLRRLTKVYLQVAERPDEEKYECFFTYHHFKHHRYIIVINKKCVVCTVIQQLKGLR